MKKPILVIEILIVCLMGGTLGDCASGDKPPAGGKTVYIAGDTENVPEMADLKNIDIAFLPMNLPYTMTPEMVAAAAKSFHPAVLYPYHLGATNPQLLVDLLKDSGMEVRIRKLK